MANLAKEEPLISRKWEGGLLRLLSYKIQLYKKEMTRTAEKATYVSSWIRLVSTSGLVDAAVASFSPFVVVVVAPDVSPFSLVLDSDLCDPDDDDGRSDSSGFGCISVNGSSATNSLLNKKRGNFKTHFIMFFNYFLVC
jgi:hypothetical protein